MEKIMDDKKSIALREGVFVFLALAVLTAVEYFIGVSTGTAWLLLFALVKAALVVVYFMHIRRLFASEGGH
jgi:heme/copper-type cytochrome/quinol oxidase subunit 4